MKKVFKAGEFPDRNGKRQTEDLDATQQLELDRGAYAPQDEFGSQDMGATDEAGFFDPFAERESVVSEHDSRTAYELGYEQEDLTREDVITGAIPTKQRSKRKQQKFSAKFKRWIRASTANKVILVSASVMLVAAIALVVWLASSVLGTQDPLAGKVDTDEVQDAIEENYSFVDKNEYLGTLLTETEDAGEEYLKETLFIGDSNFARIVMYGFLDYDNVIGVESMGIQGVTGSASVYFEGYSEPVTITKAVSLMQPRRIIICFGTNNLLTDDAQAFAEAYSEALDALQASYSYSDIIICAIPPLGENRSNKDLKQETVDDYNHALIDLAREEGYTFLDTSEVLKGANGYIKPDYIYSDGIHLTEKGFDMFFKYVRTHAHIVEDTRPKPLNEIPQQVAPPKQEVEEGTEFDPELVASEALKQFVAAGCKSGTGTTTPDSWTFTVPYDAEAGTEVNWANNLYTAYQAQKGAPFKGSSVVISSSKNSAEYVFTVTVYPVQACATHTWVDTGKVTEATCEKAGTKEQKCSVCGAVQTIEDPNKPATGHTWKDTGKVTEANCGKAGTKEQKCSVCGALQTIDDPSKPATGKHNWTDTGKVTEATCEKAGTKEQKCSVCGAVRTIEDPSKPATGHSWADTGNGTNASCDKPGTKEQKCSICGAVQTIEDPNKSATGHSWGGWTDQGNGTEQRGCSVCGATEQRNKPSTETTVEGEQTPQTDPQPPAE